MQGRNHTHPQLFTYTDIERLIPDNHLLRKINKVLDLSFVHDLTKSYYCDDNGRPSIDPEVFFRMQVIAYLYGIDSDRQLCEEIQVNIAYRWFIGLNIEDEVPDHSSLTRVRDRFGERIFKEVFERVVQQCQQVGLVKGRKIIADATLIEADASLDSMVKREEGDPDFRELKNHERRYHDFKTGKKKRKISNQTHVSSSDPHSSLVTHRGWHRKLCYKSHVSVDADSRIITDCYATTGARHECQILPERINYQLRRFKFPITEIIADKGYGRGPSYAYFRERGIRTYIPLHIENLGEGRISRGEFTYDRRNDRYQCPQKHFLYPYEKMEQGIKRYRMVGGHCKTCVLRDSCLPNNHQHRARFVYRNPHQDEIDRVKKRQQTEYFKSRLRERKWKIEGLFGEAKENHGLRRAKYRGLDKVQIQLYMTATVLNLKRLSALFILLIITVNCRVKSLKKSLFQQPLNLT